MGLYSLDRFIASDWRTLVCMPKKVNRDVELSFEIVQPPTVDEVHKFHLFQNPVTFNGERISLEGNLSHRHLVGLQNVYDIK